MKTSRLSLFILILSLLLASCQQYVFIPVEIPSKTQDKTDFKNTFASVDWDSLLENAVAQEGKGFVNGMSSEFTDSVSTAAFASFSETSKAMTLEARNLRIIFRNYKDASGVFIDTGTVDFALKGAMTELGDGSSVYQMTSYNMSVTELSMRASSASESVAVSTEGLKGAGVATIAFGSDGNVISVSNVSLDLANADGKISVNDKSYNVDSVVVDTPIEEKPALGTEANPYTVSSVSDLIGIMGSIAEDQTTYITLNSDINVPNITGGTNLIVIPSGYDVILELNGHQIGSAEDLSSESVYLFEVGGKLTINGEGTLGNPYGQNPLSRGVIVNEGGILIMNNVTARTYSSSYGSTVNVWGNAEIYGCRIYSAYYGLALNSTATVIIDKGTEIASIASNKLTYDGSGDDGYAYALSSQGHLIAKNASVYGVQGATSIIGGTAEIYEGYHSEASAETLNKLPEDYQQHYIKYYKESTKPSSVSLVDGEIFYGIYIAGEANKDVNPKCSIYGGTFISSARNSVLVGNSKDGGAGATAYARIYGGTFHGGGSGNVTVNADKNPSYGHGVLSIEGGRFNFKTNLEQYVDDSKFSISEDTDQDGYYTVLPLN